MSNQDSGPPPAVRQDASFRKMRTNLTWQEGEDASVASRGFKGACDERCPGLLGPLTERRDAWRHAAKRLISQDWFDHVVVGLILVNCVFLALDDPTAKTPPEWQRFADILFTAAFACEMCLKLMALGMLYFVDAWNWLDAVVVLEGIFSIFFDGGPSMKSLRVLRVLRPLRTVRRMPRVQLVVTSLFRAGWTLGRIAFIFIAWLTIFAIMGVLLWSGKLDNRCTGSSPSATFNDEEVCGIPTDHDGDISAFCASLEMLDAPYTCEEGDTCEDSGISPYSGMVNFDNLLWSLLTLFTVSTLEGWHEVMMFTQRVMSEFTVLFFVFLIVTATWAIMSLMIAALLARFKAVSLADELRLKEIMNQTRAAERKEIYGNLGHLGATATLAQSIEGLRESTVKSGVEMGDAVVAGSTGVSASGPIRATDRTGEYSEVRSNMVRSDPKGKTAHSVEQMTALRKCPSMGTRHPQLRKAVLSEDSLFSQVIHWAIIVNVIVILVGDSSAESDEPDVLWDIGLALTVSFVLEAVLKILVLGPSGYYKSKWNRFDFFVTTMSVLDQVVGHLVKESNVIAALHLLNILRVFRILRMRRLKHAVNTVVGVVVKSSRDMWPVVALMLLMCFVFTVLGMQLFGSTLNPELEKYAAHSYALKTRFDTFFWSFVQVFTVIAGDSWNTIMYRTMENTTSLSAIFFVSLVILGKSVMLNLVLAVVLEGASDHMKEKHAAQQFRDNCLRLFHDQYKRIAMRRWAAKVRAEAMLEEGQVLMLPAEALEHLGLIDFPHPDIYVPGQSSSSCSSSSPSSPRSPPYFCVRASSGCAIAPLSTPTPAHLRSQAMCASPPRRLSQVESAHERIVVGVRGTRDADRTENPNTVAETLAAPFSHLNETPGKAWSHLKGAHHRPDSLRGSGKSDHEMPATSDNERGPFPHLVEDNRFENHGSGGVIRREDDTDQPRQSGPEVDEWNRAWEKGWTRGKGKHRRSVLLSSAPANIDSGAAESAELLYHNDVIRLERTTASPTQIAADVDGCNKNWDKDWKRGQGRRRHSGSQHKDDRNDAINKELHMTAKSDSPIPYEEKRSHSAEGSRRRPGALPLERYVGDNIGRGEPPASIFSPIDDTCDQPEVKGKRQNELIQGQGVVASDPCDGWDGRAEALERLPKALYGIFTSMMIKQNTPKWWKKLDYIFGARVDRSTWERWHFRTSPVRQWCGEVMRARYFETVMLAFVLVNTFLSMYESDDLGSPAGALDTVCLVVFFAEICLRAGYHSWWMAPDAVLRNPWLLLDVYLVVSHAVSTTATVLGLAVMADSKRVLKSARPLRIVHRVRSLQDMSEALTYSLRSCGTLLVLIATLLFGYSMVGVEIFGGTFYSCSDPNFAPKSYRYGEYDSNTGMWTSPPCSGVWINPATLEEETRDFEWKNYVYHFDSIGPALLSALIISTLDGWVEIFHQATDAYGIDYEPSENTNLQAFWYFFAGVIVFGFYITNLFVGVMFEAFLSYKNMDSTGRLITQEERRWRDYEMRLRQVSPVVAPCTCTGQPWRESLQKLVLNKRFNNAIVSVLVVNAIVLALAHSGAPEWQLTAQNAFNNAFACIFVVETCMVMIGLGPRCYFSTGRQTFEFIVTVASLADLLLVVTSSCSGHDIAILRLVRSLRVVRVIRLVTNIPGFDRILEACLYPARVLGSVVILLAIGVYMFANLGVALFSSAELEASKMNLYQDFTSVWRAMQLLFIVATGEAWAVYASMVVTGSNQPEYIIMAFFVVFVAVMQFILTNLFIMVIVETFETLNAMDRQDLEDALPCFQKVWVKFDPGGSGQIPPKHLFTFLLELNEPLGAAGIHSTAGRYATMLKSGVDFDYTFTQVLVGLSAALLSDENRTQESYRPVNLRKVMATLVIQRALKRNMMIKQRRFGLSDIIVLSAEVNAGTGAFPNTIPHVAGLGLLHKNLVDGNLSRASADHRGNPVRARAANRLTQRGNTIDWTCGNKNDLTGKQTMGQYPMVFGAGGVGVAGSIGLPPSTQESAWLLRRFLLDLQQTNDADHVVDGVEAVVARDEDALQAAVKSATGVRSPRADAFFTSRSITTKGTEAGFPDAAEQGNTPEGPARENATKRGCEGQRGSSDRPHTSSANSGRLGAVAGKGYHSQGEDAGTETEGGRETSGSSFVGWLRSNRLQAWTAGERLAEVKDSERDGCQSGLFDEEGGTMEREEAAQGDEPDGLLVTSLAVWLKGRGTTS